MLLVVVFTLKRFYPTTSALHPVPVLILHHSVVTDHRLKQRKNEQNNGELIKVGKSNANALGTRAQETRLPRITRNTKTM